MSVLIKGMDMPEKCNFCPLVHIRADIETGKLAVVCKTNHELLVDDWEGTPIDRPDWCPIGEVHTPHGRLIDADELMERIWRERLDSRELIAQMVENAPTIIEAEE